MFPGYKTKAIPKLIYKEMHKNESPRENDFSAIVSHTSAKLLCNA